MPRSLFEGNIKVTALAEAPEDPAAVTAAELEAGVDISCAILRSGYRMSATGSETLNEPTLCDTGNAVTFGASNYEATMTVFRYLDEDGKSEADQDIAYNLFTEKGLHMWIVERVGPPARQEWASDDDYALFPVITDDPQAPTDLTGYVKFVQPLGVQGGVVLRGSVGA